MEWAQNMHASFVLSGSVAYGVNRQSLTLSCILEPYEMAWLSGCGGTDGIGQLR